jgi:hypothetical protein
VGSGADNVGRTRCIASIIVGQESYQEGSL